MLRGRIDLRRGLRAVFGCFLVFGATDIAYGLSSITEGQSTETEAVKTVSSSPIEGTSFDRPHTPYDPYVGATVGL